MDKAIFGLLGVALGVFLTVAKEWWFQSRKNKKDAEYLSIQVISMLDRFVSGCSAVVDDDGLCHGQPDQDGYHRIQVKTPSFEPEAAKVEWKSLPANLMYEVLTFPNKVEIANNTISAIFEYGTTPPDYVEGFEERQYLYAELGLEAAELASKLRAYSGLPMRQKNEWNSVAFIKERRESIANQRQEHAKQHEAMLQKRNEIASQETETHNK
ncbi:hypothetical protein [Gallaecimonas sp. GXIMD1310]|uniref:hypothetical protein n=1 Tax=Gallaecimonas sp. GXIMD1310 TaxID=3131926 RepID=UPI0032491476